MRPLGSLLPSFSLKDVVSGKEITIDSAKVKTPHLIMFLCCHCPYVIHIEKSLTPFAAHYTHTDLKILAICSNDTHAYPQDAPGRMREQALRLQWPFPYLHDPTQEVAKAFDAACTPDFFLFDYQGKLFYRGQYDSSRPSNQLPVTGTDLRQAINALLEGKAPPQSQKPSIGCNIKWRSTPSAS
jgi:hypothetical protein